jgi:hypothetical protein
MNPRRDRITFVGSAVVVGGAVGKDTVSAHGGSLELPVERTTLLPFDSIRRPAWLPAL